MTTTIPSVLTHTTFPEFLVPIYNPANEFVRHDTVCTCNKGADPCLYSSFLVSIPSHFSLITSDSLFYSWPEGYMRLIKSQQKFWQFMAMYDTQRVIYHGPIVQHSSNLYISVGSILLYFRI